MPPATTVRFVFALAALLALAGVAGDAFGAGSKRSKSGAGAGQTAPVVTSSGSHWERDFDAAVKKSKGTERMVLVFFTGPGNCENRGCTACARYERLFAERDFRTYAAGALTLVKVRFPREKIGSKEELAYRAIKERLAVKTYPAVRLADGFGNKLAQVATGRASGSGGGAGAGGSGGISAKVYVQNLEILRRKALGLDIGKPKATPPAAKTEPPPAAAGKPPAPPVPGQSK
jgi:hypothetical protein